MKNEKLEKAIIYVDRIANGCNPVNNSPLTNDSVLNNPNVIRCMYFIKDILKEVYDNGGVISKKNKKYNKKFDFQLLNKYKYIENKSISKIVRQINELRTDSSMEPLKAKPIITWLKDNGYIIHGVINNLEGSIVTEKGKSIGMYNEIQTFQNRTYIALLYNQKAQEFLINNLKYILA